MPRQITLDQHALYDEATGELEPIPAGYRLVRANDVVACEDGDELPARFLESVAWRKRGVADTPGAKVHRLPRDIPTPPTPLDDEPAPVLPDDKDALIALLNDLTPGHEYDKRFSVASLQEAVIEAGG